MPRKESDPVTKYASDAVAGKIKGVGKTEMFAYRRHLSDLERVGSPDFPYVFDKGRAERFINYFEKCVCPETGQPFVMYPHQRFDFGCLMGWVRRDTGERRFTTAYNQQARGAAKSTGCSVLSCYFLTSDKMYPPGSPECGSVIRNPIIQLMAVDKTQVDEVRDPIVKIAAATPQLKKRVEAKKTVIRGIRTGGKITVLSKDTKNKQGGKPNLIVVDEYADHTDDRRVNTVRGGMGKKPQALLYIITTAGDDSTANPAKGEYEYAKKVLSGKLKNDRYFTIIREPDDGDDIAKPATWLKSNAMYRYDTPYSRLLIETVREDFDRAFGKSPDIGKQHIFRTRRLNLWDVETEHKWLDSEMLDRLSRLFLPKAEFAALTAGKKKIVGLDLSKSRDLTASDELFRLDDGRLAARAVGYIPKRTAEKKELTDGVPYREYIARDWVRACETEAVDLTQVGRDIVDSEKENEQDIVEITYDPYKAYQLAQDLSRGDVYGTKKYTAVEIPQTFVHLHIPTQLLYDSIFDGTIVFEENECLLHHFENCYRFTSRTGELCKIGKRDKDSRQRIDMVAALIDCLARVNSLESRSIGDAIIENGGYEF